MKWLSTKIHSIAKWATLFLCFFMHLCGCYALYNKNESISTISDTIINHVVANSSQPDTLVKLTRYEKNILRVTSRWNKLIPTQFSLQYAGSIGLMNAGWGWHYGKGKHWETDMLIGFVPRYHTEKVHTTFTIKQRYIPWHCVISSRWIIEPLTTGLFFNTISGDDFWRSLPDKYPKKYYGFPTKLRTNIFLGQRFKYNIPRSKRLAHQSVSFYYELSSCDLYIVSKATNKDFPWRETLSLALGLHWEM